MIDQYIIEDQYSKMEHLETIKYSIKSQIKQSCIPQNTSNQLFHEPCSLQAESIRTSQRQSAAVFSNSFIKSMNKDIKLEENLLTNIKKGIEQMKQKKKKEKSIKNSCVFYAYRAFSSQSIRRNRSKMSVAMSSKILQMNQTKSSWKQTRGIVQSAKNSPNRASPSTSIYSRDNSNKQNGNLSKFLKKKSIKYDNYFEQKPVSPNISNREGQFQTYCWQKNHKHSKTMDLSQQFTIQGTKPSWNQFQSYRIGQKKTRKINFLK